MDYKVFAVGLFAIIGSYLIFSMPLAFATDVSIYYNGQLKGSAQISPQNIVNNQVVIVHQESDTTWSSTKVLVRVSTASLAHSIKKIYLYKCRKLDPNACMQTMPQSFDNWVDTELAWTDISEQLGQSNYPQIANLLILVKLEGVNRRISWMAFWATAKRLDYNIINVESGEINSIDIHAKSADLVSPIQSYIGNFQMVPFNWVSKVVFSSAAILYGGGGNAQDLSKPQPSLETAQTPNQITAINKDYYFIFSNTSSGVTNALTMNLNPSFTCGDNACEADLGETADNCCYDCGCATGDYCDITSGASGGCKQTNATTLTVTGYTVPIPLQQCSSQMTANITARINSPPSGLPASINGYFRINSTQYAVSCTGNAGTYNCPLALQPPVSCGFGSFSLGPNTLNMSISYKDGPNTVFKDLSAQFSSINVNYDCGCPGNFYCDIGPKLCRSEGSIMLQVLSVTSYLDNFTGANDMVKAVLRINNAPTNFTANAFTFLFGNTTWGANSVPSSHPTVNCIITDVSGSSYTYNCSVPLSIASYDNSNQYVVRGNSVNASITYTDGGLSKQAMLNAPFGDIIVPQQSCGNGRQDPQETSGNCCRDVPCPSAGQFCDIQNGCQYKANITAAVLNVLPSNVSDCTIPHLVNLTVKINNAPSDAKLNFYSYLNNGLVQGWAMQCSQPAQFTGIVTCYLTMPPQQNCSLPYSTISGNSINFSISFRNGDKETLTRELNAPFQDFFISPAWHCGNKVCESSIGESASVCCIDCPCKDSALFGSGYYCNYDPGNIANGTCEAKSNITLVIDNPRSAVMFKNCETNNQVDIRAHIENQPTYVTIQNSYGIIKGQNAELTCVQESLFTGSRNFTLNCKMYVPAEPECARGKTFTYGNNSLGIFISYRDGLGRVVTQTISAPLPEFKSTQSYKSISQITNEAVSRMMANMQKSLDIMNKLMKWIKFCITVALVLAIAEIAFTFYVAGTAGKGTFPENVGSKQWKDALMGVGIASQGINSAWMMLCNMIKEYYDIMQRVIQMQTEIIRMDTCIQLYQHQLDSGWCRTTGAGVTGAGSIGGLGSCFSGLTGCIQWGSINSYMDSITASMQRMNTYTQGVGTAIRNVGEQMPRIGLGEAGADFSTLYNTIPIGNGDTACNKYASGFAPAGIDPKDALSIRVTSTTSGCEYPVVLFKTITTATAQSVPTRIPATHDIQLDNLPLVEEDWEFTLCCFRDADDYGGTAITEAMKDKDVCKDTRTIHKGVDLNNDGICTQGETTTTPPQTVSGSTSNVAVIKNIDDATTALNNKVIIPPTAQNQDEIAMIRQHLQSARTWITNLDYNSAKVSLDQALSVLTGSKNIADTGKDAVKSFIVAALNSISSTAAPSASAPSSGGAATIPSSTNTDYRTGYQAALDYKDKNVDSYELTLMLYDLKDSGKRQQWLEGLKQAYADSGSSEGEKYAEILEESLKYVDGAKAIGFRHHRNNPPITHDAIRNYIKDSISWGASYELGWQAGYIRGFGESVRDFYPEKPQSEAEEQGYYMYISLTPLTAA